MDWIRLKDCLERSEGGSLYGFHSYAFEQWARDFPDSGKEPFYTSIHLFVGHDLVQIERSRYHGRAFYSATYVKRDMWNEKKRMYDQVRETNRNQITSRKGMKAFLRCLAATIRQHGLDRYCYWPAKTG